MGCLHKRDYFPNRDDENAPRENVPREERGADREERARQRRRQGLRRRIHMTINNFLDYVRNHVTREVGLYYMFYTFII